MRIFKNKIFWLMFFIVTLGTILRLIFIDKPDGLWNDEYVSWAIASIPFGKNFVDAIFVQCHMPFYYLYLKVFIHFFGNSDLMLRLTSVLPGILSIFSMYFVGKELKDEKLGILCASITALSSFLIYFSQEVRFYGILFLFASLSLLFTLKLGKKQSLFNFILYVISNFLIIFTHTIGFIFVFFNILFLTLYLGCHAELVSASCQHATPDGSRNKFGMTRQFMIFAWIILSLFFLICTPLLFKIFTSHSLSQWWGHLTISKLGFLITDYFSPVLTNIVSAPDNFFYNFSFGFLIFALLPSLIAIAGIIKALQTKKYEISGLFYVCLAFILTLILMAISGKLLFITKYSIEIYPILIMIMAYGLLEFKKGWKYSLIFLFCFLNLFYVLVDKNSAPKMHRSEGHKIVANLLKNAQLNKGDFILVNYYPKDRFEKYFDFTEYNVISINKGNFPNYLGVQTKDELKKADNKYFDKKFNEEVISKIKPNQKLAVVVLRDVALYSPTQMHVLLNDDKEYEKTPFLFLIFSQLRNEILNDCLKYFQLQRVEEKGSWLVITFVKKG